MTSEAEQKDLDELKAKVANARESFFMMGREILRMDETQLKTIGAKSQGDAMLSHFKHSLAECDKLTKAHIKKWPDDK